MFRKIFGTALAVVAAFTGFYILFGFLAPWFPLADSVGHFRFHLAAIMLLMAVLYAGLRAWRPAAIVAAVSAVGIAGMAPAFPVWRNASADGGAPAITAIQLNLSFRNATPAAVAAFIRRENADIVTLQEVTAKTGRVIELLGEDYRFHVLCSFARVGGVAVLSRLPRAPDAAQGCVEGQGMAWMRVIAGGQPVSVASLHLNWPYPFRQERQIGQLENHLRNIPRPVILAGDFNAAPWSHAVARIAAATDTHVADGLRFSFDIGFRGWWPAVPVPIDHILLPDGLAPLSVALGPGPGSDHRSVIARLALTPNPVAERTPARQHAMTADR